MRLLRIGGEGTPQDIAALTSHGALVYWRIDHGQAWLLPDVSGALVDVAVASRLRFDDLEVIANAAVAGMGLAWLPYWLIRPQLNAGTPVELWADRPGASMECYAVWPTTQYLPLRTRLAIDALVSELPKGSGSQRHSGTQRTAAMPQPAE